MSARRLTVLQVLPALESGGVEKGTLEVAAALVEKGHRSMVMSAGGRLVEQLLESGSEHFAWPVGKKSLSTLFLVRKLRQFLIEQRIDIVHVRSRLPAWIVYLAWKKMDPASRPRFVTTVHGFNSVSWYSEVMARGERVIAVSNSVKQYVMDNYPRTKADAIKVIHRGIDPEQYPYGYQPNESWVTDWYQQFPMLLERKLVTLPGRITRIKGHEDFVTIVKILVAQGFPVTGVIAGGAEKKKTGYFEELQALIKKEGLTDHIVFTGQRSDLREIMAISSVVLSLTTKPESFGRTTLEALSMGVPVCGYAHGGVKEQLDILLPEGEVQPGDIDAVARVVMEWIEKPPVISREHDFILNKMLDDTIGLYEEISKSGIDRKPEQGIF